MCHLTSKHQPPSASPPSAASPLTPRTSGCINTETLQASSWQQFGFRSKLFLSQTVKWVKIFHVLLKPLTIPSFLLLDLPGISPAPTKLALPIRCHRPTVCLCLSLSVPHYHPVPRVIKGNQLPLFQSNFKCWQLSHSLLSLSLSPSSPLFGSCTARTASIPNMREKTC